MSRILLIRHGESEWNALGRWQGQADPPLTDRGILQAQTAAASLGAVDAVYSSGLQRAHTTAEVISDHLGVGPVLVEPRLMERDAGEWSGMTRAEIMEAWPGYLLDGAGAGTIKRRPPGWETDELLLTRAVAALCEIEERHGDGETIVVTHGGVMYAIATHLGDDVTYIPNLGAHWVEVSNGNISLGERITLLDAELSQRASLTDQRAI